MQSLKRQLKKQNFITTSNALSTQTTKSEEVGLTLTDPNRLGDLAEHYAITWLWDEGFEVFYNAGSTGAVDIMALKDGEIYLFDVKYNTANPPKRSDKQKELGVQYILFNPKTRKLRLVTHRK